MLDRILELEQRVTELEKIAHPPVAQERLMLLERRVALLGGMIAEAASAALRNKSDMPKAPGGA